MAQAIHNSTKLLLSSIELPEDALLYYNIYSSNSADSLSQLESARRKLSGVIHAAAIFSSALCRIHFEAGAPVLYVFHLLGSADGPPPTVLDGLTRTSTGRINIAHYVSSRQLCPENHGAQGCTCGQSKSMFDQASKEQWRAQKIFLDAIRDQLINEICDKSHTKGHIPAVRLKNGFCLVNPRKGTEWTAKWDTGTTKGLIFCELRLHLMSTHILVQPIPRRLLAVSTLPSSPQHGAPILLLPYGIPAFYLGSHAADSKVISELSESLGGHHHIGKEFARCYVPFRRMSDKQDGGITTVWPRTFVLYTPRRPSIPSHVSSTTHDTTPHDTKPVVIPDGEPSIAISLTTLSLYAGANLDALSSAMGMYVDASMKERERPTRQGSSSQLQQPQMQPQSNSQSQTFPKMMPQASLLASPQQTSLPDPTSESIEPPAPPQGSQSYPSPLEVVNPRPLAPTTNPDSTITSDPTPISVEQPPPAQQSAYPTSMNLENWDFSREFPTGYGGAPTFNFGTTDSLMGTGGIGFDPFSSTFTEDDFNIFDVPTVQPTTTTALSIDHQPAVGPALPDSIMDFGSSNASASNTSGPFTKLEPALLDWDLEFSTNTNPSTGDLGSIPTVAPSVEEILQSAFTVDTTSISDFQPSLVVPSAKAPVASADTLASGVPNAQPFDEDSPMKVVDRDVDEEEDMVTNSEGFLALRFGRDIQLSDEKYRSGKYSLPSPPPEDHFSMPWSPVSRSNASWRDKVPPTLTRANADRSVYANSIVHKDLASPWSTATMKEGDLKARYMAATHPSRAMLMKLAGTKRHREFLASTATASSETVSSSESPLKKRRLTWSAGGEVWRNPTPPMEESDDDGDDGESSISGEEDWSGDFDTFGGDNLDSLQTGTYKPDGSVKFEDPVKLIQSHFDSLWLLDHEIVVPTDLVFPAVGSIVSSLSAASPITSRRSSIPPAPISVPTPVSPEALMSSDTTPRLTVAVAQQFARELSKNLMWASVVAAMRGFASSSREESSLCQLDVNITLQALRGASGIQWESSLEDFVEVNDDTTSEVVGIFGSEAHSIKYVQQLQTPKINLALGPSIVEALPSIVRFWTQLNATPLHGAKDVHAVALFSDAGGNAQLLQAEDWLEQVGKEYSARRYGSHTVAQVQGNPKGVSSIRWDNFRTVCDKLVVATRESSLPLIVYVIVPTTFANLSHPAAIPVLGSISDINDQLIKSPGKLVFHLVPEVFVSHGRSLSHHPDFSFERLALSVYDSIPRIVDREYSRLSASVYPVRKGVDAYAFVLANPRPPKAMFVEKWPPPISGMFDRYTFLHIGYNVTSDGDWLGATGVTENGDSQESRIWRLYDEEPLALVKTVLEFALKLARKADVEWRVTIAKSGPMSAFEFEAWTNELAARAEQAEQSLHVTLLSVTSDESPTFIHEPQLAELLPAPVIAARSSGVKDSTVFVDSFSNTFLIHTRPVEMVTSTHESVNKAEFLSSEARHTRETVLCMAPIATCWVVHVSRKPEWTPRPSDVRVLSQTTTTASQIHALHFVRFGKSTYTGETEDHMRNIATSFYCLMTLNELRRGFIATAIQSRQPLHIALVDAMVAGLGGLQV